MSSQQSQRMPAVFFGHGSPMNTLERNRYTDAWRAIGKSVPRPAAILAVSAHWYIRGTAVTAMQMPATIHDFGGFPQALFDYQYPAPGSPALARRVRDLLKPRTVRLDDIWGLDHGTWSVLAHVFPDADIPVVQLSIDAAQPASFHYELGRRLAPLRDEGVLIVGSGNVVHNLGMIKWDSAAPAYDWAVRFNEQVRDCIERRDHPPLIAYEKLGNDARLSVPTPEHYLPLLYVIGLQDKDEPVALAVDGIQNASISMLTVVVGSTDASNQPARRKA
jgi:4,5-DOPA dioxygenase extradiol